MEETSWPKRRRCSCWGPKGAAPVAADSNAAALHYFTIVVGVL